MNKYGNESNISNPKLIIELCVKNALKPIQHQHQPDYLERVPPGYYSQQPQLRKSKSQEFKSTVPPINQTYNTQRPLQLTTNPPAQSNQDVQAGILVSERERATQPPESYTFHSSTAAQQAPPLLRKCDWCQATPTAVNVACDMEHGYCIACFQYHYPFWTAFFFFF